MEVNVERVPEGEPNRFKVSLPEGSIEICGTAGFVIDAMRSVLSPGTLLHNLIVEHQDPEELVQAWRQSARDAGFSFEDDQL